MSRAGGFWSKFTKVKRSWVESKREALLPHQQKDKKSRNQLPRMGAILEERKDSAVPCEICRGATLRHRWWRQPRDNLLQWSWYRQRGDWLFIFEAARATHLDAGAEDDLVLRFEKRKRATRTKTSRLAFSCNCSCLQGR